MTMATDATIPAPAMAELQVLLHEADGGVPLTSAQLLPFTRSADNVARGLAKRALAHVWVAEAQEKAVRLLEEACDDLEYRVPVLLNEALEQVRTTGDLTRVIELHLRAAAALAKRGEYVPALVELFAAGATDFKNGAELINDPVYIRRIVALYEQIAAETRTRLAVARVAKNVRRSPAGGPLRLAHVTAQLVDGGHAPSRVIASMLKFRDRERFTTSLYVTEALAPYSEHTTQKFGSNWTPQRAPELIRYFTEDLGVPVRMPACRKSLLSAMHELHAQMAADEIDVAFFHGSIITPADWLLCAWQAAPWQFDCGMGVPLHCPAVDHQFFEFRESVEQMAFLCRERGISYSASEYCGMDLSHVANVAPFPRAALQIPDDHVVLGTIGNHLPVRMSEEFCRTVAAVLRARPKVTYCVIGAGEFGRQRERFGEDLCGGPTPRVRFCGQTDQAAALTQMFDIYVNEYPAGGGIAVCEAMAARKAVVGMRVNDSSLALAGHMYLGDEFSVRPATNQAYADRLVELIDSREARAKLGAGLFERYERYFNGRAWIEEMTEVIYRRVMGR